MHVCCFCDEEYEPEDSEASDFDSYCCESCEDDSLAEEDED